MAGSGAGAEASRMRSRILVIDDEPTLLKAIKRMLRNFDVTTTSRARDALAMIESGARFDVIVSDMMMPEMSGVELLANISRCAPEQCARIVFMTGGTLTEEARALFERHGNLRLEKPFDSDALLAVVAMMLS